MLSRRLRWTLPLACSVSLVAGSAWAVPTVQLTPQPTPVVTRVDATGSPYGCPERNSQAQSCLVDGTAQGIGYHDCIDDTKLRFSLAMTGVPDVNYDLQVWAGTTDCTQAGATNNNTTGTCWKVAPDQQMAVTISPLDIRVADIVSGLGLTAPNIPQTYVSNVATTTCNDARGVSTTTTVTSDSGVQTSTAGVATVTIYFLVFGTGQNSAAPVANASYPVKVKLVGPNAVSGLTVKTGDGEIILDWTPPSGDPTVQGFDLFAVPEGTTVGADSGSTTVCSDASTEVVDDAGNPVLDDAGNPIFVPGDAGCTTTSNSSTATCGSTLDVSAITCPTGGDAGSGGGAICDLATGTTTNSGTISGLTNGTNYVATVAAYDQYGNAGTPTQSVCETPAPIDDFWKVYNQDGGNPYCALSYVGARGSAVAAGLVGMFGMIWLRRRKRR